METEAVDLNNYTAPAQLSASKFVCIVETISCYTLAVTCIKFQFTFCNGL
jgi:hypothetical protein